MERLDRRRREPRRVLLMRHAPAEKNRVLRYGGDESALVQESYGLLRALARELDAPGPPRPRLVSAPHLQCRQTASVLAEELGLELDVDEGLLPADVGEIAGRAFDEVQRDLPALAARLLDWRSGALEVHELAIPGMVDPQEYYRRSQASLARLLSREADLMVVASLSVLIGLGNVLLGRTPGPGGGYRCLPFPHCGRLAFVLDREGARIDPERSTFLPPG